MICCRIGWSPWFCDQMRLSRIRPSLKRRNSAFSPQNLRNAAAAFLSSAGGPWSTDLVLCSESTRRPTVTVPRPSSGPPAPCNDHGGMGGILTSIRLTRLPRPAAKASYALVQKSKTGSWAYEVSRLQFQDRGISSLHIQKSEPLPQG